MNAPTAAVLRVSVMLGMVLANLACSARMAATPYDEACAAGLTRSKDEFFGILTREPCPDRIRVLALGDSWFSFPNSNVLRHIENQFATTRSGLLLDLADPGAEASALVSGAKKLEVAEILRRAHEPHGEDRDRIAVLLFSGGGNDLLGAFDLDRLLRCAESGTKPEDFIRYERLERKLNRITLAYRELLEIRNEYSPETLVIAHTYDIASPSGRRAQTRDLVAVQRGPWLRPYLRQARIPEMYHADIVKLLLNELKVAIETVASSPEAQGKMIVVDTHGTLKADEWEDEIHATPRGFRRIAARIYSRMRKEFSGLPEWVQ